MYRYFFVPMLLAMTGCSASSNNIKCPAPETGAAAGTLRETSAQIAAAGAQLGHGGENEIAEVAATIRSRHADAPKDAVINYLVTAYCPRINGTDGLSPADKQQALDAFSARAERIVR